jgi:uncharacterized membrane protein
MRERGPLSTLVVVAYSSEGRAAEVMASLRCLEGEGVVYLDDGCHVTCDAAGRMDLHRAIPSCSDAAGGGAGGILWDSLVGLLAPAGAGGGTVPVSAEAERRATDIGVDGRVLRELAGRLGPRTSAIFLLVRRASPDSLVAALVRLGGTVLLASLPDDAERRLCASLAESAREEAPAAAMRTARGLY